MTTHESEATYEAVLRIMLSTGIRPANAGFGRRSKYFKFYTVNRGWISIRVSDHYANDENNILSDEYYDVMTVTEAQEIVDKIDIIDTGIPSEFGSTYKEYRFD